jgi:hypothetical protein
LQRRRRSREWNQGAQRGAQEPPAGRRPAAPPPSQLPGRTGAGYGTHHDGPPIAGRHCASSAGSSANSAKSST